MKHIKNLILVASLFIFGSAQADAGYSVTFLNSLGGTDSGALGINESGQVVGYSSLAGVPMQHATLWNGTIATDLVSLSGAYSSSFASSINNSGQVVGVSETGNGTQHATLWNGTIATDLGTLGGPNSVARDINNSGQVVGESRIAGSVAWRATLWNGTPATDLGIPGELNSFASAINNSGQVVGHSLNSDGSSNAIIWNGTTATVLEQLSTYSWATAINDSGHVVGNSILATGSPPYRATLWNGTSATYLSTADGNSSFARAINNSGQVVGSFQNYLDGIHRAVLWKGTVATDLNSFLSIDQVASGWVLNQANDINNDGSIVGVARNSLTGAQGAFLVSAVPEPETYALMLVGLGLVGTVARRRRATKVPA